MDDLLNAVTPNEEAAKPTSEENSAEPDVNLEEGTDETEGEDSGEEVAYKGKAYKVDKEIAEVLKKAESLESDYTRKTMAVAELRKAAEAEFQQAQREAAVSEEIVQDIGQLKAIESRLSQFQNVNWQQWFAQDPNAANAAQMEYTQLRDIQGQMAGKIEARKSEIATSQQQRVATAIGQAIEMLNKPDAENGWDGKFDSAKQDTLTKFGLKMGFTKEELSNTTHPLMIKTLNLARIGAETLAKQKAAGQPAKPAALPVPQIGARKSPTPILGLSDNLSQAEWLKRRNAQVFGKKT